MESISYRGHKKRKEKKSWELRQDILQLHHTDIKTLNLQFYQCDILPIVSDRKLYKSPDSSTLSPNLY